MWIGVFHDDPRVHALPVIQRGRLAVVSSLALAELESLAVQGRVRGDAAGQVRALARVEPLTDEDALQGGRLHGQLRAKGRAKVSLPDTLMLATARRLGTTVITLDTDLRGERDVETL